MWIKGRARHSLPQTDPTVGLLQTMSGSSGLACIGLSPQEMIYE